MDLAPVEESVVRAALGMNEQKAPAWAEPELEVGAAKLLPPCMENIAVVGEPTVRTLLR